MDEVLGLSDGSFRTSRHFEGDYVLHIDALNYRPLEIELYDEDIYSPISALLEEKLQ